jgi:hypothetical protein
VLLLLVLTFNAYACVLPLQASAQMDCPVGTEEPSRQTCDAFREIGPLSEQSAGQPNSWIFADVDVPVQLSNPVFKAPLLSHPLRSSDSSIHFSIPTTVLRI